MCTSGWSVSGGSGLRPLASRCWETNLSMFWYPVPSRTFFQGRRRGWWLGIWLGPRWCCVPMRSPGGLRGCVVGALLHSGCGQSTGGGLSRGGVPKSPSALTALLPNLLLGTQMPSWPRCPDVWGWFVDFVFLDCSETQVHEQKCMFYETY